MSAVNKITSQALDGGSTEPDSAAYVGVIRTGRRTRGTIAAGLDMLGATWNEHHNPGRSIFVVRASERVWLDIEQWAIDNGIPMNRRRP